MRRPLLLLAIALAAGLAACASSTAPAWTYAPPTPVPSVTPAPSGASAAPSEATGSGAPADGTVKEAALKTEFVTKELAAPADAAFKLEFDNQDAGVPHNIEIKDPSGASVFKGELITGLAVKVYDVPALGAGDYTFICTVHPNMTGTLRVGS